MLILIYVSFRDVKVRARLSLLFLLLLLQLVLQSYVLHKSLHGPGYRSYFLKFLFVLLDKIVLLQLDALDLPLTSTLLTNALFHLSDICIFLLDLLNHLLGALDPDSLEGLIAFSNLNLIISLVPLFGPLAVLSQKRLFLFFGSEGPIAVHKHLLLDVSFDTTAHGLGQLLQIFLLDAQKHQVR